MFDFKQGRVAKNDGQDVIEIVGNAGRERAHGLKATRFEQSLLQLTIQHMLLGFS